MAKRPSFQFYPADWLRDLALRSCSAAARGLWIDMMCFMHEGADYGYLKVGDKVITEPVLASMVGIEQGVLKGLLNELKEADVFSVDENGCIYSRRMVRDESLREKRAAGGKKGASHGHKGGRPKKITPYNQSKGVIEGVTKGVDQGVIEGVLKKGQNNPPSSSSSSSIIYISKEGGDYFRIGLKLFEQKPSEYLDQNHRQTVEKFMMSMFRGLELGDIYRRMDEEYYGYEFNSENHLRNSFKSVGEKMLKDRNKGGKANTDKEPGTGFVRRQKPMGAVRHG